MIIVYMLFAVAFLYGMTFFITGFNKDYISKEQTSIINGIFVLTIFSTHFMGYIDDLTLFDRLHLKLMGNIGQLMVTTFFFYSGYGIFESIKNKSNYIKNYLKNRIFPLWFNLSIGVTLFLIMDLILKRNYPIRNILLSYVALETIGNSNWFIFTTFVLYAFVLIVFNDKNLSKIGHRNALILMAILSLVYVALGGMLLNNSIFVNTTLCFVSGMIYSYYKERIEVFIKNKYCLKVILSWLLFLLFFFLKKMLHFDNDNYFFYNLYSIIFVSSIVITSMKMSFKNKFYELLGKYVFWIYILQRIPMICLKGKIDNNYLYFITCFIITIVMSYVMNKFSKFILQDGKSTFATRT